MFDRTNASPPPTTAPRDRPGTRPVPAIDDSLPTAVDAGLEQLRNLAMVEAVIGVGDLEQRLRTALGTDPAPHGRAAAHVACVHLAAGQLTAAHFALLAARDQILIAVAGRLNRIDPRENDVTGDP